MLEHVATVVVGRGERGRQVRGRAQELRVAESDGGPHGEERGGSGRDPASGRSGLLCSRVELAEHHPDRSVEVLQHPVRPGQKVTVPGAGHLAQQDDVLAPQDAVRPVQQRPQPLRGLDARMEELRLNGFGTAGGAVNRPGRQAPLKGGGEVGTVGGHLPRVVAEVHGSGLGGAGLDEAQRPGGEPGRWRGAAGGHRRAVSGRSGATSSPPIGAQSHAATTMPADPHRLAVVTSG